MAFVFFFAIMNRNILYTTVPLRDTTANGRLWTKINVILQLADGAVKAGEGSVVLHRLTATVFRTHQCTNRSGQKYLPPPLFLQDAFGPFPYDWLACVLGTLIAMHKGLGGLR